MKIEHKAYWVWYEGDDFGYFTHAETHNRAKRTIAKRQKYQRGYMSLHAKRFYDLDNTPITYSELEKLGYVEAKGRENLTICTCSLCKEYRNEQTKENTSG